jgi:hypothetical protein
VLGGARKTVQLGDNERVLPPHEFQHVFQFSALGNRGDLLAEHLFASSLDEITFLGFEPGYLIGG